MLQPVLGEATSLAVFHSGILSIGRRRNRFHFLWASIDCERFRRQTKNTRKDIFQFYNWFAATAVQTATHSCGRFRCQSCVKARALGWMSPSPFGPLQPWHGAASWERLSDPLQRRAGRFTGRRAERSANNKDGQRAVIPRRCLFQVPTRTPVLGCIKEVGYNCAYASVMRANDARREENEEASKRHPHRSVINFWIIAHCVNITANDESPQESCIDTSGYKTTIKWGYLSLTATLPVPAGILL